MSASIGQLVWFSVHGTREPVSMALTDARKHFADLDLDPSCLPKALRPVSAFQAASASTQVDYVDDFNGDEVSLRIRIIRQTPELHERHVIRHALNPTTKLVRTSQLIELKFHAGYREGNTRRPDGHRVTDLVMPHLAEAGLDGVTKLYDLSEQDHAMATLWLDRFKAEYELLQTHMRADALRKVLLDILVDLDAVLVNVKGGTYLVLPEHAPVIARLATFVHRISEECSLSAVTLSDTPEHMAIVSRSWREAVRAQCQRMINDAEKARAQPPALAGRAFGKALAQSDEVRELAIRYAALDGTPRRDVDNMLAAARKSTESLKILIKQKR